MHSNKSEITPESDKVLMGALKTLQIHTDIIVEISGHTDNVGSNATTRSYLREELMLLKHGL